MRNKQVADSNDIAETLGLDKSENTENRELETFIKVKGEEFSWKAINITRADGWISFDRINTKSGQMSGHYDLPMTSIERIEKR